MNPFMPNVTHDSLKHMTLRQTKMLAKKADGPFSCYIDAPNGYCGLSTVAVLRTDRVAIFAPHMWEPKALRTQPDSQICIENMEATHV